MNHHIFCYLSALQVDPPDAGLLADILWPGVSSKGAANLEAFFLQEFWMKEIPSRELTYPPKNGILKMIFLFPRWNPKFNLCQQGIDRWFSLHWLQRSWFIIHRWGQTLPIAWMIGVTTNAESHLLSATSSGKQLDSGFKSLTMSWDDVTSYRVT